MSHNVRSETARNRWKGAFRAVTLLLFVLVAAWSFWPLPKHPAQKFPSGQPPTVTVELFNLWTIWWNSDRAPQAFSGYWDAPVFFPYEAAFAFSEPQPLTVAVAPVIWITGSRVLGYNVYLLVTLVLNGLLAALFLRRLSVGRGMAAAGGVGVMLLPIIHGQRDVLQLIPVWGILWVWIAFLKISRRPSILSGIELGLAFTAVVFSSVHHALFLTVLMLGSAWISYSQWARMPFWKSCAAGVLTAALLSGPLLLQVREVMNRYEFNRPSEKVSQLSALPVDYVNPAGWMPLPPGLSVGRPHWRLGVGWFRTLAAVAGIVIGLRRHRRRQATLFLLSLLVFGFLLSLGPHLKFGSWQPWNTLAAVSPGIAQVRNPFRFCYFVQLAVILLAAQGLYDLWLLKLSRLGREWLKHSSRLAFFLLAVLLMFEVCPGKLTLANKPDESRHRDWIDWLGEHSRADEGVLCLPMAPGNLVQDFEITVQWMYFGTFHKARLVNGYSGFFPEEYLQRRNRLRADFPSEETLNELRELNVRYVVVDHQRDAAPGHDKLREFAGRCVPVFQSESQIGIYRLVDPEADQREPQSNDW